MASRSWVFTLNNYTETELSHVMALVEEGIANYVIIGREVGETGTPHLQGFIQLPKRRRLGYLKEVIPRAHLERSRDPEAAITYCQKDGDWTEYGTHETGTTGPGQDGARKRCYDAFKAGGATAAEEAEPIIWAFSGHTLGKTVHREPTARPDITCLWIWGAPGVGKSRKAWAPYLEAEEDAPPVAYAKDGETKWWNGYRGEADVVIDDLCEGGISIAMMLKWCDRYPCRVETKGGMEPLMATKIVVTSNFPPRDIWPKANDTTVAALTRRFTIEEM